MDGYQQVQQVWASRLRQLGIQDWVANLLECAGPFSILGAQIVYLGKPLLSLAMPGEHLDLFAKLLEEPEQTQAFADMLREDRSS
jgi:hypothetical protein